VPTDGRKPERKEGRYALDRDRRLHFRFAAACSEGTTGERHRQHVAAGDLGIPSLEVTKKEEKMTIGKILLELNELSRHTDAILHNAEIGQMFTLLADAIRHANAERLADLDSVFQERNGTTLPDGASDVEEY
jgi:hypothetical protein